MRSSISWGSELRDEVKNKNILWLQKSALAGPAFRWEEETPGVYDEQGGQPECRSHHFTALTAISFFFHLVFNLPFIFNWRIIALQCCVDFCHTSIWISHRYTYESTCWKRPWCWERLRERGEGGDRGWDGWMASLTQWTWVPANSRR